MLGLTSTWVISDLVQRQHPKIGWNRGAKKPAISPKRCKLWPRLLWRTNRKSHTRFRLVPKSMTLVDLDRPKRHSCRNEKKFYRAHRKIFNEDRPILSAAKCGPVVLVSRNIRYMRIFEGVPRGGGVNYYKCYTCVQTFYLSSMKKLAWVQL